MQDALDIGLEMAIFTRLKESGRPWFNGYVHVEGADYKNDGIYHLNFFAYDWQAAERNEAELKAVEEFINNHKK